MSQHITASPRIPEANDVLQKRDQPMRWAIGPSGAAVHVFSLPRELTGAKCSCTCPGCGEALHAVNAGLYSYDSGAPVVSHSATGRSLSPFFRHPAGYARGTCLQKAAQLAALTLFKTQEIIDVPAPRGAQTVLGVSGRSYSAEVKGLPQRLVVRRTLWSDAQQAVLETATGEKVLVILHSAYMGEEGLDCDGVITVECDDPDIAGMPLDELLSKVALSESHTCWAKHWTSGSLSAQALADAQAQAFEALDWIPPEMQAELEGQPLTKESLLHLAIKQIIAQAEYIVTPTFAQHVIHTAEDNAALSWSLLVTRSSKKIRIENTRLEHWMRGMVPDIYCDAVAGKSRHPLLIEVKVTHGVPAAKLELIRRKDLLCMEVDVERFTQHGKLTRTQLKEEVLDNAASKVWLHHPSIEAEIQKAREKLLEQEKQYRTAAAREETRRQLREQQEKAQAEKAAQQKREAAAQAQKEQERQKEREHAYRQKLLGMELDALLDLFATAVLARQRSYFVAGALPLKNFEAIVGALHERGHPSAKDRFFTAADGPLSVLTKIQYFYERGVDLPEDVLTKLKEYSWMFGGQEYLPVLLWALRCYPVTLTDVQAAEIHAIRISAWTSMRSGSAFHVRNEDRDPLLARIFPALAADLARPEGKSEFARVMALEAKKKSEAAALKQRLEGYERMLAKIEAKSWVKALPTPSEYERLYAVHSLQPRFERVEGFGQARLRRVLHGAYGDAKKGGKLGNWLGWAVVELGGEPFKSERNLQQLVEMLKNLKLLA